MAISLPTFTVRQILTAGILNQLTQAINTKFSAITGADITWDLLCGGNIDFDGQYGILGLKKLWSVINADEYTSLQAAIDEAESNGGGTVFIPPDTTISTPGVTLTSSNVAIVGAGPSSVIQLESGNDLLDIDNNGALTDISIQNLTLDGAGETQNGVVAKRVQRLLMDNVYLKNFDGSAIKLTSDTPGEACSDVILSNIWVYSGGASGSAYHLHVQDVNRMIVSNFHSTDALDDAIFMEPAGSGGLLKDIMMDNVSVNNPATKGIYILGADTVNDKWSRIGLSNCQVFSPGGTGFHLGAAAKILKNLVVDNCKVYEAAGDGFVVMAEGGKLSNLFAPAAGADGLDMTSSKSLLVTGCDFNTATATGIDATSTDACKIATCDVTGSADGIIKVTATDLIAGGNIGAVGLIMGGTVISNIQDNTSPASGVEVFSYTIPANTLSKPGDCLVMEVCLAASNDAIDMSVTLNLDANIVGAITSQSNNTAVITSTAILNAEGIDQASNTNFRYMSMANTYGLGTGVGVDTIDWTTDIEFMVSLTQAAGQTGTVHFVKLSLFEGEYVAP